MIYEKLPLVVLEMKFQKESRGVLSTRLQVFWVGDFDWAAGSSVARFSLLNGYFM